MNKTEFIEMCTRDAGNDDTLLAIVEVFKEVIPVGSDVETTKDPKSFYDYMKDYASKHRTGDSCCINPTLAKKLAIEYLNLNIEVKEKKSSSIVNLEDFF